MMSPPLPVGPYPTFSPLFRFSPERLFSVILLWAYVHLSVRKHGILYCPDFPPRANGGDRTACEATNLLIFNRFISIVGIKYLQITAIQREKKVIEN